MAIKTEDVGFHDSTITYTSVNETAVTFMSLCNHSGGPVTCDIHVVPSGDVADTGNLLISAIDIVADDTYIIYQGNEKIFLANGDHIAVAPAGVTPILATATVSGIDYTIVTLGTTDFTLIGATELTTGAFVTGDEYIITNVGDTNFTLIGASANTVGVIFTATGPGDGTTGTAIRTLFTATGVGTGTGTVTQATIAVLTSYMEV